MSRRFFRCKKYRKFFLRGQELSGQSKKIESRKAKGVRKVKAIERRQELLNTLCRRRHDKIDNLAFEFCVSERTIRRDIQELSLSYPIYTDSRRNSAGVHIEEGYYLNKQYLKPEQKAFLETIANRLRGEEREKMQEIIDRFGRPDTRA